jgi:hypothetical protein
MSVLGIHNKKKDDTMSPLTFPLMSKMEKDDMNMSYRNGEEEEEDQDNNLDPDEDRISDNEREERRKKKRRTIW